MRYLTIFLLGVILSCTCCKYHPDSRKTRRYTSKAQEKAIEIDSTTYLTDTISLTYDSLKIKSVSNNVRMQIHCTSTFNQKPYTFRINYYLIDEDLDYYFVEYRGVNYEEAHRTQSIIIKSNEIIKDQVLTNLVTNIHPMDLEEQNQLHGYPILLSSSKVIDLVSFVKNQIKVESLSR